MPAKFNNAKYRLTRDDFLSAIMIGGISTFYMLPTPMMDGVVGFVASWLVYCDQGNFRWCQTESTELRTQANQVFSF